MRLGRHFIAGALALVAVTIIGYLTVQAAAFAGGYLVGLDGLPMIAVAKRFAWELYIGMLLFGIGAVAAHRKVSVSRGIEITVLLTLTASFLVSGAFMSSIVTKSGPVVPSGTGGLLAWAYVSGGSSPFTIALIAFVAGGLLLNSNGRSATEADTGDRATI